MRRTTAEDSVILTFDSHKLPDRVLVGCVEYKVFIYTKRPTSCRNCGRLGHIADVCRSPKICLRCAGIHQEGCDAGAPLCINCSGEHAASYWSCPMRQQLLEVARFRRDNPVDMATAKAIVASLRDWGTPLKIHSDNYGTLRRRRFNSPVYTLYKDSPFSTSAEGHYALRKQGEMKRVSDRPWNPKMRNNWPFEDASLGTQKETWNPPLPCRNTPRWADDGRKPSTCHKNILNDCYRRTQQRYQPTPPWKDIVFAAARTLRDLLSRFPSQVTQVLCEMIDAVELNLQKLCH